MRIFCNPYPVALVTESMGNSPVAVSREIVLDLADQIYQPVNCPTLRSSAAIVASISQ